MRFHWWSGLGFIVWRVPAAERRPATIARCSPDAAAREEAVRQLQDPRLLEWLALKARDPLVRRMACGKLDSLGILFRCLSNDADVTVRWHAIDRARAVAGDTAMAGLVARRGGEVQDQSLLASLVFETAVVDPEGWREIETRGGDPHATWRQAALELELAAVAWVRDPGLLAYLACHHRNAAVRDAARARYPADGPALETVSEEVFPYGCPTCQYVSDDPLALRVSGCSAPDFKYARVDCPRCHRSFDVSPSADGGGTDWVQNLSNGPLFWEVRDCPECNGRRTLYRVEFPRDDQCRCRRCGWGESKPIE